MTTALIVAFAVTQTAYLVSYVVDLYFFTRPVDWVDVETARWVPPEEYPFIVLLYPVLRESEETMRTTMLGLARLDYPADRYRIIAVPNIDDETTIGNLLVLQSEFAFLEILPVPATTDPSWQVVWDHWDGNPNAYWWHLGKRAGSRDLPAKKTRQLTYAFHTLLAAWGHNDYWLLNYIDADSVPPHDHFLAAAAGIGLQGYDVLQSTNIAGNLLDSWTASCCAMDHMAWDGHKYPHLSAGGKHPYWVLGKGLFFKASDLVALGGFNPWLTIEDPDIGMRLWMQGKRLGIIAEPLVEEVPLTLRRAIIQRKRWVCGFFQSLGAPTRIIGMSGAARLKAWLNFLPCLLMAVNPIGLPVGIWALVMFLSGHSPVPVALLALSGLNIVAYTVSVTFLYVSTWRRTALVLGSRGARLWYLVRVNPLVLSVFWLIWVVPLVIGFQMFLRDKGQVWERTEKVDANHDLVRHQVGQGAR